MIPGPDAHSFAGKKTAPACCIIYESVSSLKPVSPIDEDASIYIGTYSVWQENRSEQALMPRASAFREILPSLKLRFEWRLRIDAQPLEFSS